jgi:hypothetical protein
MNNNLHSYQMSCSFSYIGAAKIIRTISFLIKRSQNEDFFRFHQYKNDHYVMYSRRQKSRTTFLFISTKIVIF